MQGVRACHGPLGSQGVTGLSEAVEAIKRKKEELTLRDKYGSTISNNACSYCYSNACTCTCCCSYMHLH